jgi:hypothetical protein
MAKPVRDRERPLNGALAIARMTPPCGSNSHPDRALSRGISRDLSQHQVDQLDADRVLGCGVSKSAFRLQIRGFSGSELSFDTPQARPPPSSIQFRHPHAPVIHHPDSLDRPPPRVGGCKERQSPTLSRLPTCTRRRALKLRPRRQPLRSRSRIGSRRSEPLR